MPIYSYDMELMALRATAYLILEFEDTDVTYAQVDKMDADDLRVFVESWHTPDGDD